MSLSAEIGYQRREYSADTWTLELRPIVDEQWGRWYLALPTLERALRGPGTSQGLIFSPKLGPALDLNLGPDWEFNLGALTGLTRSTDRLIVKMILGRRFGAGREPTGPEGRY